MIYWPVISVKSPTAVPWGSDTLGHVSRLEFLAKAVQQGILSPAIYPAWYMGIQLFRYYPPLTYYVLILIEMFTGQAVLAVNWLIVLCALFGGLSFLLYKKWIGWLPAIAGGLVYLVLPDNVRVAFSEGNIPRIVALAFVPLLFYFVLDFIEKPQHKLDLTGICALFLLFVFCHPMMAAIYAVFTAICALLLWWVKASNWRSALSVIASILLGIGLGGWWLLPSLTGGITELNAAAVTQGLSVSSLSILLNPFLRLSNPEVDYAGLSLVILCLAALFVRHGADRRPIVFTVSGLLGILAYTPFFNQLFNSLPAHNLLWPYRFQGICGFLILLSSLWLLKRLLETKIGILAVLIVAIIFLDAGLSWRLIGLREPPGDLVTVSTEMGARPGWREVTLDNSRLGSQAAYFIDQNGRREQVFGWAYQGAKTASNAASLNDALDYGAFSYLRDRLSLFGVDDVVALNDAAPSQALSQSLSLDGFLAAYGDTSLTYLHRDGSPRAVVADWQGLAIGKGAVNYSFLFPRIVQGDSIYVDDYALEQLVRYRTLVLAGFSWHDKPKAETLIQAAADQGVNVVVDLTHAQQDPIAQISEFLGVWGEPIIMDPSPINVNWLGVPTSLAGFGKPGELWYTLTPQGIDQNEATFNYLGQSATVIGSIRRGQNKIWFLGLNLIYHTLESRDANARKVISSVLQLESGAVNDYTFISLGSYASGPGGYTFTLDLGSDADVLVPIARFDGSRVWVDGNPVPVQSLENLILFSAPAGKHQVRIGFMPTTVYRLGLATSGLSGIMLIALAAVWVRKHSKG